MLYVDKNNNIRLTRGDTAKFVVSVQNESIKEPYDILSSDTLTMTIKDSIRDGEACIQKTITGSNAFHILPSDTSSLNFGKYIYDIGSNDAGGGGNAKESGVANTGGGAGAGGEGGSGIVIIRKHKEAAA